MKFDCFGVYSTTSTVLQYSCEEHDEWEMYPYYYSLSKMCVFFKIGGGGGEGSGFPHVKQKIIINNTNDNISNK